MKENKITFTVGGTVFKNPYRVIPAIFSFAHIEDQRTFIKDILLYSTSSKRYQKEDFGSILLYLEHFSCLLAACFVISKQRKGSPIEVRTDDMLNSNFYSIRETTTDIWSEFPRSLTQEEFLNPYKALKQVFKSRNPEVWSSLIKDVTDYACGNYGGDFPEINSFEVYQHLCKLLEAAHLINVREIEQPYKWRSMNKGN